MNDLCYTKFAKCYVGVAMSIKKFDSKHPQLSELIRFLIIGTIATLIDFAVMSLIIYIPNKAAFDYNFFKVFLDKKAASTFWVALGTGLGFTIGFIFSYIFSLLFVYKSYDKRAKSKRGFLLFLLFSVIGLCIQTIGVSVGFGVLGINEWIVKIFFVFVVLVFNYTTRKKYIFNSKTKIVEEQFNCEEVKEEA